MRKAVENKTEYDMSKPINLEQFDITAESCFGRLWLPQHKDCSVCADLELCGTIYHHTTLNDKIKKVKKSQGINFLDDVNFDRIPKQELVDEIKKNPGKVTSDHLIKFVKHWSKCDDEDTLIVWIQQFKMDFNIKIKKGLLYAE